MIGVPLPNPRDQLIDNLNQQLDAFFGAGNQVKQVAPGVSGEREAMFGTSHSNKLRLERDKLAPRLKELADKGLTVIEAAKEMGMETKRARLIARENSINFPGPQ
ncbi:hypothetical protein [Pseudomonas fluorescens]|uniref:hypothetical protein n=1 Tax=Pseudomonas fluorescens TaxID=294 RepID=UPI00380E1C32